MQIIYCQSLVRPPKLWSKMVPHSGADNQENWVFSGYNCALHVLERQKKEHPGATLYLLYIAATPSHRWRDAGHPGDSANPMHQGGNQRSPSALLVVKNSSWLRSFPMGACCLTTHGCCWHCRWAIMGWICSSQYFNRDCLTIIVIFYWQPMGAAHLAVHGSRVFALK